jgi:hypothetical protein
MSRIFIHVNPFIYTKNIPGRSILSDNVVWTCTCISTSLASAAATCFASVGVKNPGSRFRSVGLSPSICGRLIKSSNNCLYHFLRVTFPLLSFFVCWCILFLFSAPFNLPRKILVHLSLACNRLQSFIDN